MSETPRPTPTKRRRLNEATVTPLTTTVTETNNRINNNNTTNVNDSQINTQTNVQPNNELNVTPTLPPLPSAPLPSYSLQPPVVQQSNDTTNNIPTLPSYSEIQALQQQKDADINRIKRTNAAINRAIAKQRNKQQTTTTTDILQQSAVLNAAQNTQNTDTSLIALNNLLQDTVQPPQQRLMRDIMLECKVLAGRTGLIRCFKPTVEPQPQTPVKQQPTTQPTTPPQSAGPRMQLDASGNIVLNTDSLTIDTPTPTAQQLEIVDETDGNTVGIGYGHTQYVSRWSLNELKLFYRCIAQYGLDFSFIAQLYPNRTRAQIKSRYNKEERLRPQLIDMALQNKLPIDVEEFERYVSYSVYERDIQLQLEEQQQLQLIEAARNERAARKQAKAQADSEKRAKREADKLNKQQNNNNTDENIDTSNTIDNDTTPKKSRSKKQRNNSIDSTATNDTNGTDTSTKSKKSRSTKSKRKSTVDDSTITEIIDLQKVVPTTGSTLDAVKAIAKQDRRNKQAAAAIAKSTETHDTVDEHVDTTQSTTAAHTAPKPTPTRRKKKT